VNKHIDKFNDQLDQENKYTVDLPLLMEKTRTASYLIYNPCPPHKLSFEGDIYS